jgi:hypothetical protein
MDKNRIGSLYMKFNIKLIINRFAWPSTWQNAQRKQQYSIVLRNLKKKIVCTLPNKSLQTAENASKSLCEVSGFVAQFHSKLERGDGFY